MHAITPIGFRQLTAAAARRMAAAVVAAVALYAGTPAAAAGPQVAPPTARGTVPAIKAGSQTFNTVITKLKAGKQIFSNTIVGPDLDAAKKACEGVDFIWIEMQHSTLTWREVQQLIKVV